MMTKKSQRHEVLQTGHDDFYYKREMQKRRKSSTGACICVSAKLDMVF